MLTPHVDIVLFVTGAVTASMVLQFAAPRPVLRSFFGLDVSDEVTLFFARNQALPVALIGVLLIWAGLEPELRTPVVTVALIGKAAFVAAILAKYEDFAKGYLLTVVFDSACVLLYGALLLGL